jgi:hypothetical protein
MSWLPKPSASSKQEPARQHTLVAEAVREELSEGVRYEKRPVRGADGKAVAGLYIAWITLDNPTQFNSYTTDMVKVLKDAGIPYIAFKYAENSGQMQPIREQAGTFADSIKLWSGT